MRRPEVVGGIQARTVMMCGPAASDGGSWMEKASVISSRMPSSGEAGRQSLPSMENSICEITDAASWTRPVTRGNWACRSTTTGRVLSTRNVGESKVKSSARSLGSLSRQKPTPESSSGRQERVRVPIIFGFAERIRPAQRPPHRLTFLPKPKSIDEFVVVGILDLPAQLEHRRM